MCLSVNGSVCLVCCVFDSVCESLVKQFAICFGVVVILLNVREVFSVGRGALLDNKVYLKSTIQTSSMDCTYKPIKYQQKYNINTMSMCKNNY